MYFFFFYCHGANNIDPDLARCCFFRSSTWETGTNWFRHSNKYWIQPNCRSSNKISEEIGMLAPMPPHFHHSLSELFTIECALKTFERWLLFNMSGDIKHRIKLFMWTTLFFFDTNIFNIHRLSVDVFCRNSSNFDKDNTQSKKAEGILYAAYANTEERKKNHRRFGIVPHMNMKNWFLLTGIACNHCMEDERKWKRNGNRSSSKLELLNNDIINKKYINVIVH